MEHPELISAYEAARILEVTPATVYSWLQREVFDAYRDELTGQILLRREDVEALRPENRRTRIPREKSQ